MKHLNKLFLLLVIFTMLFSCSSDDDNLQVEADCITCENLQTEYCFVEGDTFYRLITNNQSTEIDLNDQTWEEIKVTLETECLSSLGNYALGYFITNEGNFGSGIGTLSFVGNDGVVIHNVYQTVNGEPMGNLLQSMYFYEDNAYLVLNGSHKVIVTNRYTMEKIATIEGENINNPRYFVAIGDKGYVSNWNDPFVTSDDFIAVIDLNTNTVESTISVDEGPEDLLINDAKLYVNLQGGYGQNNKVLIIDTDNDSVITEIPVGDVPNSIKVDKNDDIWIVCGGKPSFTGNESSGSLVKISDDSVVLNIDFELTEHPEHLSINSTNDVLYYALNGKIYNMNIESTTSTEISGYDGFYYGMSINNDKLYTLNAGDFNSEGELKIFDLNTNTSEIITTGIIPNSVVFQ